MNRTGWIAPIAAMLVSAVPTAIEAHITPAVTLRTQADVIRTFLPNAVKYKATTVRISKAQFAAIASRAHYTPESDAVKFYSGEDASGHTVGTVVFPQVDTQHGPVEVGVVIDPAGKVEAVSVTRVTVEMKPWMMEAERSGVFDQLKGTSAADSPKEIAKGALTGMPGYMADVVAAAAFRGLQLFSTLRPA